MTNRPYISSRIDQLETLFSENTDNVGVLEKLLYELEFRKTKKAKVLCSRTVEQLEILKGTDFGAFDEDTTDHERVTEEDNTDDITEDMTDKLYGWDPEQEQVIGMVEDAAILVEAGPGAGKTAVACARVAHLIEQDGLEPSKIFMISFTRAAVKELQDRIKSHAENPINIAGLRLATLDSFTWQVVRGISGESTDILLQSYEGNIQSFIDMMEAGDESLINYLDELEHVIIDEGQDLVGIRSELIISLIRHLPDTCGVTVFADSAQAIYGFTDDMEGHNPEASKTVVERIYDREVGEFTTNQLHQVHRTDDPKLLELYRIGREQLINIKAGSLDEWKALKKRIMDNAHGRIGNIDDEDIKGKRNTLVLFRTRSEVLMNSSMLWKKDIEHKIRMSGIPPRIHPWIARVFSGYSGQFITRDKFMSLWKSRINKLDHVGYSPESAWELLEDNVGEEGMKANLSRLREILMRDRPPVDFLMDEHMLPGPVLGTIHASKGREADVVYLMLPADRFIHKEMTPQQIAEEERVLFVGATRARKELYTGQGFILFSKNLNSSNRTFRFNKKTHNAVQLEFGRTGDLNPAGMADQRITAGQAVELQGWLWDNAEQIIPLMTEYDSDSKNNVLYTDNDQRGYVGTLSKWFTQDLWDINNIVKKKSGRTCLPMKSIRNIRMVGVSTAVVRPEQRDTLHTPYCDSGFVLVPVITGFPMVYFNYSNWKQR